jgi:large exoprotein involved in heme utilization and adhesion
MVLLRRNSQITASTNRAGNGGNIAIATPFLIAIPDENSDVRANSLNASGGNITVNTSGIFGFQLRNQTTPLSDISATGANSALNGTIQLNVDNLSPIQGLTTLPATVVEAAGLISQGCPIADNSFVITGRGGIPPSPEERLENIPRWSDRRYLATTASSQSIPSSESTSESTSESIPASTSLPIPVEATTWHVQPNGGVVLTATVPVRVEDLESSASCERSE